MSGEFTVKLPQRIPTAGVSGDTQKKAGAADAQLLLPMASIGYAPDSSTQASAGIPGFSSWRGFSMSTLSR